jgi:hypothetical protein
VHLNLRIDFAQRSLFGYAEYSFEVLQDGVENVLLDSNVCQTEITGSILSDRVAFSWP